MDVHTQRSGMKCGGQGVSICEFSWGHDLISVNGDVGWWTMTHTNTQLHRRPCEIMWFDRHGSVSSRWVSNHDGFLPFSPTIGLIVITYSRWDPTMQKSQQQRCDDDSDPWCEIRVEYAMATHRIFLLYCDEQAMGSCSLKILWQARRSGMWQRSKVLVLTLWAWTSADSSAIFRSCLAL